MKFEKSTYACMISFANHRGIKFDSDYDLFVTFLFFLLKIDEYLVYCTHVYSFIEQVL